MFTFFAETLDALVRDIERQAKNTESLWHHLPYSMCNKEDLAILPSNDAECWNGDQISRYFIALKPKHLTPSNYSDINVGTMRETRM